MLPPTNTSRSHSLGQLRCPISRAFKNLLPALLCFTFGLATSSAASFGVAGHSSQPAFPVYQNLSAAQQLDKVKELGVTYYRVDASDVGQVQALVDAVRAPGSPYANIKIIPIIYSWFSTDDLKTNPNNFSNAEFYASNRQRGKDFTMWWIGSGYGMPFEAIEIGNELDLVCIRSGEDGKDLTDYHDEGAPAPNTIQGSYWRCKSVIDGLADGIREAHGTVKRLVGCAGWYHYGFIDKLLIDCGNANWEGVVYHWYSEMGLIGQQPAVRNKLQSYGKPVWITEVNNRNGSLQLPGETVTQAEQRQADGLAAQVNDLKSLSFVTAIFPYELFDEPNLANQAPNESRYGFYRIGGSPGSYYISGRKDAVFNAFQAAMAPDLSNGNYRLANRWTGNVMHIENLTGKVQYGSLPAGAWSSHWTLAKNGDGYYTVQSRWTGAYSHIENQLGYLQYGANMGAAWSAQWILVKNGDGYYTIINRWTGAKLHTENLLGYVQYGTPQDSAWSAQWSLTVVPAAPAPTAAAARRTHGAGGAFDIPVSVIAGTTPPAGQPPVECRSGGTLSVVATFDKPMLTGLAAIGAGTATISDAPVANGNTLTVSLSGVSNIQTLQIKLSGMQASQDGDYLPDAVVSLRVLHGDVNGDGVVNAVDLSGVRNSYGKSAGQAGFDPRADLNVDGVVNSVDTAVIRANYGSHVP